MSSDDYGAAQPIVDVVKKVVDPIRKAASVGEKKTWVPDAASVEKANKSFRDAAAAQKQTRAPRDLGGKRTPPYTRGE